MAQDTAEQPATPKSSRPRELPPIKMFPRTEGQAMVTTFIFIAVFVAALGYAILRGLGLSHFFGE